MKLSIITVNLNNRIGLSKTMNSVFYQTFRDFEYIIIDGASNDGSIELVNDNLSKINYFISEVDNGIYCAMNKAILIAKGDYCLFLNSGDYLVNKNTLKKIFSSEIKSDIVIGKQLFINSKGNKSQGTKINKSELNLDYFFSSTLPHQSTFINRNVFNTVGLYKENYKYVSDWIFWIDAIVFNKCTIETINLNISYMEDVGTSMEDCINEMSNYFMQIFPEIKPEHWVNYIKISKKAYVYNKCKKNLLSDFFLKLAFYISKRI